MKTEFNIYLSGISVRLIPETFEEIQGLIAFAMNANSQATKVFSMTVTNRNMCATLFLNRRKDRISGSRKETILVPSGK